MPPTQKNRVDMLVRGGHIVTMDDGWTVIRNGAVAIDGGAILEVGKAAELLGKYQPAETIGTPAQVVMPGLINAHTHAATTLFRGFADDRPLKEWLEHFIWPAEAKFINPQSVYGGTLLAVCEMIRSGTVAFLDMYFFEEVVAQAASEAGMRVVLGELLFDFEGPNKLGFEDALKRTRDFLEEYRQDPLVSVSVAPHSTYTVSVDNLVKAKALADEFGALYTLHASESAQEVADMRASTGVSPPRLLHQYGLLGENVALSHGVHLDDDEIALLAESGTAVVHCPEANLKLGSGIARLPALLRAGLRVGLGTDGPASNNDLNLWDEVQMAAKLHLGTAQDPTAVNARQAVYLATRGGAEILGLGSVTGSIEPGKQADLIILDFDQPHLVPLYDVYSHLAYAVGRSDVNTTMVNGVLLMKERRLLTVDEAQVVAQVQELGQTINHWLVEQKKLY